MPIFSIEGGKLDTTLLNSSLTITIASLIRKYVAIYDKAPKYHFES